MLRKRLYSLVGVGLVAGACALYWHATASSPTTSHVAAAEPDGTQPRAPRLAPGLADRQFANGENVAIGAPAMPAPGGSTAKVGHAAVDEAALMNEIHASLVTAPKRAEILARQGRMQFPGSPHADERDMLVVLALINQRDDGRAREEMEYYQRNHPDGRYAAEVARLRGSR